MALSRQQCNDLRVILKRRYNALLGEIQADRAKAGIAEPASFSRIDPDEPLTTLQAVGVAHAELDRDWEELKAVQRALTRLENGEYGTCTDCGGSIPWRRLLSAPAATRCLGCQQDFERRLSPS